jgi:endonuclease/exonuclease/phosphatase family metal-dependent hydrolase
VRIVSYNIHGCAGPDRRRDPGRIAAVLEALAPDVVALQEVDSRVSRGGLDQATILARRLGMELVEGPLLREHAGHYGNAVLSRWPVRPLANGLYRRQGIELRGWLEVEVTAPCGASWRVLTTHLDLAGAARSAQLRELTARLAHAPAPIVLGGDLNEWRPWRRRLGGLAQTVDLLAAVPTFPGRWPLLALDRLAVRAASVVTGPTVDGSESARHASDHLPLWAELASYWPGLTRVG